MGSGECEEHDYENRRPRRGPITHVNSEERKGAAFMLIRFGQEGVKKLN